MIREITLPIKCSTVKTIEKILIFCNPVVLVVIGVIVVGKWWEENKITFKCREP